MSNNIDLEDLNKIPQFKAGLDSLRDAVNQLNKSILTVNTNLNSLNKQSNESTGWLNKAKTSVSDLAGMFNTLTDALTKIGKLFKSSSTEAKIAEEAAEGWAGIIAAAFTLILTYGPQVLNFFGNLFQSDKAKEAAKNIENYNNLMTAYITNVSGGLAQVNTLMSIAGNNNLGLKTQSEALQRLINLDPEHLRGLTLKNLKTKEGITLINEYTKSLKRQALEESAQSQIKDIEEQRQSLKEKRDDAQDIWNDYKTGRRKDEHKDIKVYDDQGISRVVESYSTKQRAKEAYINTLAEVNKEDKKYINQITAIKNTLAKKLMQVVATHLVEQPVKNKTKLFTTSIHVPQKKSSDRKLPASDSEIQTQQESAGRMALLTLEGYAKEVEETNQHFNQLIDLHKGNNTTVEQLERERVATLESINKKFQNEGLAKLSEYENSLNKVSKDARQQARQQLDDDYRKQADDVQKVYDDNKKIAEGIMSQMIDLTGQLTPDIDKKQEALINQKIELLTKKYQDAHKIVDEAKKVSEQLADKNQKDKKELNNTFDKKPLEEAIQKDQDSGNWQKEYQDKQKLLDLETQQAITAVNSQEDAIIEIKENTKAKQAKLDKDRMSAEAANQKQYLQTLDKLSGAVGSIFGKNTVAAKAAFKAHQAAAAAQVIIDTKQAIMGIWSADARLPIIGVPKAIAETAIVAATGASNLASILKQKPGFSQGGQYVSDGRGALLTGYSRYDNTNAYLRSGEAVVVSEAMRNPWARNLVSAINVAHGGRDFSIPNPDRGYAIGGIFTDGGNANRYYSQPVNDQKDLANTLAYQMLNNFPPIYVDVKDINNQQNILAQTVNRVNL